MAKLLLNLIFWFVRVTLRSQHDLILENVALRQQLAILKSKRNRPVLHNIDRVFWVALQESWMKWKNVLVVVKPETVVRWHKEGFRLYWRWKCKSDRIGRAQILHCAHHHVQRALCVLHHHACETTDHPVRCYNPSLFRMGCSATQKRFSFRDGSKISDT